MKNLENYFKHAFQENNVIRIYHRINIQVSEKRDMKYSPAALASNEWDTINDEKQTSKN